MIKPQWQDFGHGLYTTPGDFSRGLNQDNTRFWFMAANAPPATYVINNELRVPDDNWAATGEPVPQSKSSGNYTETVLP
jgi:hypothetical protein